MSEAEKQTIQPIDTVSLHKEIDLIQNCINRMAKNSFMIKGWTITLVSIIWTGIGIGGKWNSFFILIVLLPTFMFWGLDGFFLMTEKRYRKLYDWTLKTRIDEGSTKSMYCLNISKCKESWIRSLLSKTVVPFYGVLVLVIFVVFIFSTIGI